MNRNWNTFFISLIFLMIFHTVTSFALNNLQIKDYYSYDKTIPLNAEEILKSEDCRMTQYDLFFDAEDGDRVHGVLTIPKMMEPQSDLPVIIYFHGYQRSASGDLVVHEIINFMLNREKKYAILALDARYYGYNQRVDRDMLSVNLIEDRADMCKTIIDNRRAIDYLEQRDGLDENEVFVIGPSLGGMLAAVFSAVDERVKAVSLIVTGGNWEDIIQQSFQDSFEPLRESLRGHYEVIPHLLNIVDPCVLSNLISPRYLQMHNAIYDSIMPTGQELFDSAKYPKQIFWYDAGHLDIEAYSDTIFTRAFDLFDGIK